MTSANLPAPASLPARLLALVELSCSVRVYVPSTRDVDAALSAEELEALIARVAATLSGWFGGATVSAALGCWASPAAGLVKERVALVSSFCDSATLEAHAGEVLDLALSLKSELSQESIALEINGRLYLV